MANVSIGVCSQNHGNQVPGGICKLTGGANACSNAQSDCECVVSPKAQCCAYDTLGLPRCLGSGRLRRRRWRDRHLQRHRSQLLPEAGQTCNTAAECCGLTPCVPDSTGTLPLPDHHAQRRRHRLRGEGRDLHGDRRLLHRATSATSPGGGTGTCGPPPTPPPADAGVCALYGQACNAGTPCCNGVQCTYSPTNTVCNGQQGCTCYNPIVIGAVTP